MIAFVAWRTHTLTGGGALAAFAVGTATFGALGLGGAAVLLAFFVPSVALSRAGRARKTAALREVGKSGPRDGAQVLANGGVAAVCAVVAASVATGAHATSAQVLFAQTTALHVGWLAAFGGAFAAATADTWGTEIGLLSGGPPRSILTFRKIDPGLSGGISALGTVAEIAGAIWIAGVAQLALALPLRAVVLGGFAGALVDSLLGASAQALRWCPNCRRPTEREPHTCGANTRPLRGLAWLGNDGVNFCATLAGAAVAYALAR
ncbi:MAG: DUF92 domain-containing protein [Vulcanimicrobiaceae bacterium]